MQTIFEQQTDLCLFEPYRIDCGKCCGLCCVALYFSKSDGFPKDKDAGVACGNLRRDYQCSVYSSLSEQKLKGCLHYDCFGAGQYVTNTLKSLPDWSAISSKQADLIFRSYLVVLRVHQTLWYVTQCLMLLIPQAQKEQASLLIAEGTRLLAEDLETLSRLDPGPFCQKSNHYLKQIGALCMSRFSNTGKTQSTDYMGKNLREKKLAGKDFSMSLLIAANLEQASLCGANFLGADMRDTKIRNTDLSQCLFLSQIQLNSAIGDRQTVLPPFLHRPDTWETV